MADGNSEIEGYAEFQRATDEITRKLPETMADSSGEFAREWVSAAQTMASTAQQSIAAQSLMVVSSGDGATIQADSPLFFGAEFGGQGRPETMQFPPFQGQRGYFFYPARRANEERLGEIWGKGVDQAFEAWDRHG